MNYKLPKIVKCCCCVPLDYGVIVSVYIKITLDLALLTYYLLILVPLVYKTTHYIGADITDNALFKIMLAVIVLFIDVFMNIIFIVSSKLKNYKLMRTYYYYTIYTFAIIVLYFVINTFSKFYFVGHYIFISRKWREMIQQTVFEIMTIGLHYYFVLMIRSKLLKIKRNKKLESNKIRISKIERNTPEPGTSSNNYTNSEEQIELKEIVSAPSESFNYKKF